MNQRAWNRLNRLEVVVRPRGCDVCRCWDGTVIADDSGARSRPETCLACGRCVPYTQRVALVGVALEDI